MKIIKTITEMKTIEMKKTAKLWKAMADAMENNTKLSYADAKQLIREMKESGYVVLNTKEDYEAWLKKSPSIAAILPENPEEYYSNN